MKVPKYGTPKWREWHGKLVAEAYEALLNLMRERNPPKTPRTYDPIFAVKKP